MLRLLNASVEILLCEGLQSGILARSKTRFKDFRVFKEHSVHVGNRNTERLQIVADTMAHKVGPTANLYHVLAYVPQGRRIVQPRRRDAMDILTTVSDDRLGVH